MEDLIYKFLIQSGFPRASIVTDITAVNPGASSSDASFIIVDPQSADCLAILKVVGAVNDETLIEVASLLAVVANSIGGQLVQGYVIRVDGHANREAEQVQFYRCHPNTELQQLTARTFPDLDSLKVNYTLIKNRILLKPAASLSVELTDEDILGEPVLTGGMIFPGVALVLLAVIDWSMKTFAGSALFDVTQAILLVAGAVLLSVPALLRYSSTMLRR